MEKLFMGFYLTYNRFWDIIRKSLKYLKGENMADKNISELKIRISELVDEVRLLKRDVLKLREDVSADIKDLYVRQQTKR